MITRFYSVHIRCILCLGLCLMLMSAIHCFAKNEQKTKANSPSSTEIYLMSAKLLTGWHKGDDGITINRYTTAGEGDSNSSLLISGQSGKGKWSYARSFRFFLIPDRRYLMTGWMRVRFINSTAHPPHLRVALFKNSEWVAPNFATQAYNLANDEWQRLSVEFQTPPGMAHSGNIALEKGTNEMALDSIIELKDLQIEILESHNHRSLFGDL